MDQVQEIKSKINIVDIIGESVRLKKAGRNFQGLCPFHGEKTPSFSVSPELQIFKCFGCGKSGDVITFVENNEGLEFYDALKILAERAGVTLKKFDNKESDERDRLKQINFEAARFYHYILLEHKKGEEARAYLKNRGLKLSTVKTFMLGYAPTDIRLLADFLSKKKIDPKTQEDAGLIYRKNSQSMDRFRGRVVFPINDIHGDTIALAGRILPSLSDKGLAKYINSPETKIYHKSRSLFGIDKAKRAIKDLGFAVLVEGEMDLLSSFQAGVKNVVAIKGTAITPEHITILSRLTKKLTLALDSDFAGDNAGLKGIAMAQNQDIQIKALDLGDYKDPDEFAQAEPERYLKSINEAEDVWELLIEKLPQKYDLETASGKAEASQVIVPLLMHLENEIVREHYLQKLAQKLGVSVDSVNRMSKKFTTSLIINNNPIPEITTEHKDRTQLLEEEFIVLMLRFFPRVLTKEEVRSELNMQFSKRIISVLEKYLLKKHDKFDFSDFIKNLPNEIVSHFSEMVITYNEDPNNAKKYVEELFFHIKVANLTRESEEILKKMIEFEKKADEAELKNAQLAFQKVSKEKTKLEQIRNISIIEEDE